MSVYKNVVFDFNGTLLDDCQLCLDILNLLCEEYNLPSVSLKKYKEMFTFPVYVYYKQCGFDVEDKSFIEVGNKFHAYYNNLSYKEAKLFKNVKLVLRKLKENNIRLICLSASKIDTLIKQLKYYEIYDFFNDIIGLNDTYAHSKLEVAKNFINESNINLKETLLVGDSIHDFEVSSEINVDCCLVSTGHTCKKRLLNVTNNVINDIKSVLTLIK